LPQFTAGVDYEAFVVDLRNGLRRDALPRNHLEASRRLPDDLKARRPAIAWKNMAGAGWSHIFGKSTIDRATRPA
jgi:uncharacterized protein with HEPN domain